MHSDWRTEPFGRVRHGHDAERWYAVHTVAYREDVAAAHLARQGFEVFVPRRRRTVRHARRLFTKATAFFPGYIFTCLDPQRARWRSINGTIGVRAVVGDGQKPIALPGGMVEGLKAMTNRDGIVDAGAGLREGERVRILNGPFADLVGELLQLDDSGRIRVLLDIMNGRVPITLQQQDVIAAD